ncbi:hybrid sensor histidine kinase/response regulator [Sphingomonas sp. 10B4]|uniref:hybrid sensor histidine kinase/response regulator n=1 Tax=Sphingomonas sp. 10B4 TaxID=3048575 RepID=UPI002AB4A415|nr:PAS domain-containing protein [Sphingomonas sp. 10B4]MDY7525779.1 PAS domain-containing protein [Sphingomonas sp. 10B4]MEB0281593.1 PAS domain-containing protein [Sphingomonas sp. 10B4]
MPERSGTAARSRVADLLDAVDWAAHPLGPREGWPTSLKATLHLLLASPESMYLVWGETRTFFFNDAYAPILGPRIDGAMGARFDVVWADAYAAVEPMFLDALRGTPFRVVDHPVPMARWGEPEETWWTFSFSPVFDDLGAITGVLCITSETTATVVEVESKRRVDLALQQAEQSLRRAEEAGHIGVFTVDLAEGTFTGSAEFYHLFGLSDDRTTDVTRIEDMILPEDAAIGSNAAVRASQAMALQVEYRIRRADTQEVRWIERRAEFEYDANGTAVRLLGVVQDVTERRADRDALAKLNATLAATVVERTQALLLHENIIQSDATAICAFDTDCRLIAFNQAHNDAFFRSHGFYTKLGEVFFELFVPEQRAAMHALMTRALHGETFVTEAQFGNPEIEAPSWEIRYSPLRDAEGRIIGAFHHARDVTGRLRAKAELATAQEALRQAQKMEAMGQLTGGVAHDFNNLLTPIVGALDLLQRKGLGGEREKRLIDGAALSAERARTLVQRLLAFARRQPLQAVAVDVAALVRGMIDLVASTIGPQIRVLVEAPHDLPTATADPNQLEMALLNLVVNARDAMPDGGTLRIAAMPETIVQDGDLAPGRYICLSVTDTGTGMSAETMARAVEPFFSTKGVGKGTGLGLSMVHGLASQLGGALRLRSTAGEGTCVELWLPQGQAVAPLVPAAVPQLLEPSRGTALLVDDEEFVRLSTAAMLGELGYDVVEADSAEAALALIDAGVAPDLVVTDHLMPGMTGSDFARRLLRGDPALPVLVISGYAESEGIAPDLPRLTKPFRRDELLRSLVALSRG